ncbi:glycosyltransferase family 2 protein [Georgenia sp. EYE_87]|uniref:glycosyltransferase n=1 Tax=Georgenia sp. EYE_87 TaxID=2853448 RepID=UPI002006749B|nr:glycosyltransferase [Georgenia sp. EYE_87]MCK6211796.1 glycosyltransferase family 2 protein [Georgenia sp. EYE_87]
MAAQTTTPVRPSTLAVVVSAGVSVYLQRTLAALAAQTHLPEVVLVVDVGAPGRDLGTGVPVHDAVAGARLDEVTRVRVVRAPEAATFGEAVRQGLEQYGELVERAAERARKRERATGSLSGSWSRVTGELTPVTTGEIRAVGVLGHAPDPGARPDWLWLLHDDSAPHPAALDQLLHAAESGRSVAILGAKQRDWAEPDRLLEVGVRATRTARRVADIEPGEIDQGQHDHREDVLAVGTAGALVRRAVWEELGGTDPALGPFGDGLELSRRARLAGHRVVVVPTAVVHHARASYLGLRGGPTAQPGEALAADGPDARRSFLARRRAQLYNGLVAAPAALVPVLVAGLLLLAPLRALWRVATKEIGLAGAEIAAALAVLAQLGALRRARRRTARVRRIPARALVPLQASGQEIRRAKRDVRRTAAAARHAAQAPSELEIAERAALARRRRTGATLTLVLLTALALAAFAPLVLAGPLTGGALLPADATWGELWRAARTDWVGAGDGHPGPADPLLQVLAVAMLPLAPFGASANALVTALVVLAVPLAGLGAWFAAGAATRSVGLRAWAAVTWALAPALLLAAGQGRLGALLAHVLLPWVALGIARAVAVDRRDVVLSGMVGARRTARARAAEAARAGEVSRDAEVPDLEGPAAPDGAVTTSRTRAGSIAAGAGAALALAGAAAGAPVLLPASLVTVVLLALVVPRRRRVLLAVPLPALVVLGPLVAAAVSDVGAGSWRLLLADPGVALASDAGPSWLAVLGWPVEPPPLPGLGADGAAAVLAQWGTALGGATLAVGALLALLRGTGRAWAVRAGWLVALVGLVAALVAARTDVAVGAGPDGVTQVVRGWAGPGTSLVVLGLLVAVVSAGDGLRAALGSRTFGVGQVAVAVLAPVLVLGPLGTAAGWLASVHQGGDDAPTQVLAVHGRGAAPVPAVAAEMQGSGARSRVLALSPAGETLRAEIWRGAGPQLTAASAVAALRDLAPDELDAADAEIARTVAAMSVGAGEDVAEVLGGHAVGIVVVPPEPADVPAGMEPTTTERAALIEQLDATAGLDRVTENESGVIWRVSRESGQPGSASSVARARVVDADGAWEQDVEAGPTRIGTELPSGPEGRTLVLAERADPGWRAWYDGRPLRATTDGWRQAFELPAHTGTLTVSHEAPGGTAWAWVQGIVVGLTVLLALPIRRRRTEVE